VLLGGAWDFLFLGEQREEIKKEKDNAEAQSVAEDR
jgi:hypothetical protein